MKKHLSNIILVLVFLLGLSVLLYPSVSDYWNSFHQSRAIVDYDAVFQSMNREDYTREFEQADAYNSALRDIEYPLTNFDRVEGYEDTLNVTGTGIMGYINIDKIKVQLPIYHGTSEGVLNVAVGHIQGSSLPTGGPGTHSVFSAHRGLPSARLFSDLDKLEPGDTFTLTVLDRVLTYQVDQVLIVQPFEVESLGVQEGQDLCTLVTCTPYGINSHRLLVRGRRTENAEPEHEVRVVPDAIQIRPVLIAPIAAVPMLLVLLVWLLIRQKNNRSHGKER